MKCQNCNIQHDGSFGSGRFCSNKCARAFSSKKTQNIKNKISISIKNKQKHIIKCLKCQKQILVASNVHKAYCNNCKSKKCKCCGQSHKPYPNLCKHFNYLKQLDRKFNFHFSFGTTDIFKQFENFKNYVYQLYWIKQMSIPDLQKKFNLNRGWYLLKFLEIPRKSFSEAGYQSVKNNKIHIPSCTKYKAVWHITWDNKHVYLRSSYQLKYALQLDNKKIPYFVQHFRISYFDSIKKQNRIAIPDFYLPATNEIIEIKSSYTLDIINMKDKFLAYKNLGYNCTLIVDFKKYDL